MALIKQNNTSLIKLRLVRNLVRTLKRGHPWVFANALRTRPPAPPGSQAVLLDNKKGRPIALGIYDSQSPLSFRVCALETDKPLTQSWAENRLNRALTLRTLLFGTDTTGYRLFNGEGDGLPGLICDVYGNTAVIQLDGDGPAGFWNVNEIAHWVAKKLSLQQVYFKTQSRSKIAGKALVGNVPTEAISFLENGVQFTVDVINGQKTGFFLDQRENRKLVGDFAKHRRTLNLFGYTGGFSVMAGLGGAAHVTTVDLASPALQAAEYHWQTNALAQEKHQTIKADAFAFLDNAVKKKQLWDMVIVDPPSFTASKETVEKAISAYQKLVTAAAAVTGPNGFLAVASCSSHLNLTAFLNACEEGISKARRRTTILYIGGQPPDHPTPLAFPEFRYLKFIFMRVN